MWCNRTCLAIALLLLLGLSSYQLGLPGLHYDEAVEVVPTLQLLSDQPTTTFRDNGVWLGGRRLPLMTQDYIGALNTYLALPFFVALGVNVISLRVMALAIALVTLCLAYRLAEDLAGRTAANVTALLLAVSPTFVFWSRQGVFVTSVTAAIGLAAGLTWLRWWRTGRRRYALGGAFLFGLGLYAKLLFLWLIVGLTAAAVICLAIRSRGQLRIAWALFRDRVGGWHTVAGCAISGAVGCGPLVAFNVQTGGTLASLSTNLTTSYYGTNNLAFLPNLLDRFGQFDTVLAGAQFWYLGATYSSVGGVVVLLAALVAAVWLTLRDPQHYQLSLVPGTVIIGALFVSGATVSALWITHFAVLSPWPALAAGSSVGFLARRLGFSPRAVPYDPVGGSGRWRGFADRRMWMAALAVLLLVGWISDVVTDVRYHQALSVSGGLGAHSDAVYDLADWLEADRMRSTRVGDSAAPIVAMDWGIAAPVTVLTGGAVPPIEAFGFGWSADAALSTRLDETVRQPKTLYLWRAPDEIVFDRSEEFRALYSDRGLEEDIVAAFYERSGRPVLGVTRLVPIGAAVNPPR